MHLSGQAAYTKQWAAVSGKSLPWQVLVRFCKDRVQPHWTTLGLSRISLCLLSLSLSSFLWPMSRVCPLDISFFLLPFCFLSVFAFFSVPSPGWSGTYCVDQVGLDLSGLSLPLPHHLAWSFVQLFFSVTSIFGLCWALGVPRNSEIKLLFVCSLLSFFIYS